MRGSIVGVPRQALYYYILVRVCVVCLGWGSNPSALIVV